MPEGRDHQLWPVRPSPVQHRPAGPGPRGDALGPNGAGKTTAVRILTTLAVPDAGRASVAGHDVVAEAMAVRRSIGVTAQDATVDEMLTGRQNLVMIGRLAGLNRRQARATAADLLERFSLADAAFAPLAVRLYQHRTTG